MFAVLDEAGFYFGGRNDDLKEELRQIDGVPNATYLVKDGRVFVFDKLIELVKVQRSRQPSVPLADLARALIADATVSPDEATEQWGVVPHPYEMIENPHGELAILHRAFNALLPGTFKDKREVQAVFARLLLNHIHPGNGSFSHQGQGMILRDPLDTALLPPRPVIPHVDEPEKLGYTSLRSVSYEQGFEPVSEALFDDVKEMEANWKNDSTRVVQYVQDHAAAIWARSATLRLELLDNPSDEVPEYGQEDFVELRPLYPELSMLSDGSLYWWFDAYQSECCCINGWTANRDDDFLFYLIGKIADRTHKQDTAKDIGQWTSFALLRGDSLDAAFEFAREAILYNGAISRLAWLIADAMRFVALDKKLTDLRGQPVMTFMDMFRMARMFSITTVVAEQNVPNQDPKAGRSV
jgi:hypothetical protein